MKSLVTVLALVFIAVSPASSSADERVEGTLAWLESADPVKDFASDLARGNTHFIELTGQAPVSPHVSIIRRIMCYQPYAPVRVLEVGYCLVSGDDDVRRRDLAYSYGETYNKLLLEHLDSHGMSDCGPAMDWDGVWQAANEDFDSGHRRNSGTITLGRGQLRIYLNDFARHEKAARAACALLNDHGLDRNFNVVLSPRDLINTEREDETLYTVTCSPTRSLTKP